MKKQDLAISLLLGALAVVVRADNTIEYLVMSTHPCRLTDYGGSLAFDKRGETNGGYYCPSWQAGSYELTRLSIFESGENSEVTANEPEGLRFKGWWTKAWMEDEDPTVLNLNTIVETKATITGAKIKTAKVWKGYPTIVAKYVPIYDVRAVVAPEGAGTVSGARIYEEGEPVSLSAFANGGYALREWQKDGKLVSPTNFGFVAARGCEGTYTAVFTGKVYRVDLRPGKGEAGTTVVSATYGQPMPTPIVRPERYGYDFGGYFNKENGQGDKYYNAEGTSAKNWDKAGPADLYAYWVAQQGNFNLKFNPGVAKICYRFGESSAWVTNTPPNKTILLQVGTVVHAYALPSSGYEIADYHIEHQWQTEKDVGVPRDGITFSPTAVKVTPTFTVTFVDPIGAYDPELQAVKQGEGATAPEWRRIGYELGWDVDFSSVAADMTVTAVWTPITSVVRFDPNGGSGTMADQIAVYDQALTLALNKFVNGALFFAHWTTSVDQVEYPDGAVVSNLTTVAGATNFFYAVWEKHSYSIRFNANGGAGEMADQPFDYGESKSLTKNAFTRTGWRFVRWDGPDETTYEDEESVSNLTPVDGKVIELFAVWSDSIDNPYSIAADCARTTDSEMAVELTPGNEAWCEIVSGGGCTRGEAKYVRLCPTDPSSEATLSFRAVQDGKLSFYYKTAILYPEDGENPDDNESVFDVIVKPVGSADKTLFTSRRNIGQWTLSSGYELGAGDEITFRFSVGGLSWEDGDFAGIDGIRFVPDGGGDHPDPEAKDAVEISSAAVADGKFSLSFVSDEKFDYNLLTNANLLIDSWGVMATKPGTGETVVFDPPVIDGMPQLFYKVETIRKQD